MRFKAVIFISASLSLLASTLSTSATATAGVISGSVSGTVVDGIDQDETLGLAAGMDLTGQSIDIQFEYDTSIAPMDLDADPSFGEYFSNGPPNWLRVTSVAIGGSAVPQSPFASVDDSQLAIVDDALGAIEFSELYETGDGVDGYFELFDLILEGAAPGTFGSDQLPSEIDSADFSDGIGFYGIQGLGGLAAVNIQAEFSIADVSAAPEVPEPASAMMWCGIAIAALGSRRGRSQQK